MNKVVSIVTSDWHLSDIKPKCRGELNWVEKQIEVISEIVNLCLSYNAELWIAGDIFDKSDKCSSELYCKLVRVLKKLPNGSVKSIMGNHDMIMHNRLLSENSAYMALCYSGAITDYNNEMFVPFNSDNKLDESSSDIKILHRYTYDTISNIPDISETNSAEYLCNYYKKTKVIFTGDNHSRFIYNHNNTQHVYNCGSIMIRNIKQKNYKPSVFIFKDDYSVSTYYLKSSDNDIIIDRDIKETYFYEKNLKNDLMNKFIEILKTENSDFVNFKDNLYKSISGGISEEYVMNKYKNICGE